jgi:hypothetical protein
MADPKANITNIGCALNRRSEREPERRDLTKPKPTKYSAIMPGNFEANFAKGIQRGTDEAIGLLTTAEMRFCERSDIHKTKAGGAGGKGQEDHCPFAEGNAHRAR